MQGSDPITVTLTAEQWNVVFTILNHALAPYEAIKRIAAEIQAQGDTQARGNGHDATATTDGDHVSH